MKFLIISLKIFLFFTVLTGIIYPLIVTGFAQAIFREKANGSLIYKDNRITGSSLIGQQFDTGVYFSSRPSAIFYNPIPSGGSNFGITNSKLINLVRERKLKCINFNKLDTLAEIPSEMLFASASGLDPHISPGAAYLQVERIARVRCFDNIQKQKLMQLVKFQTEDPQFLCLGEARVNVLLLNLETDKIK